MASHRAHAAACRREPTQMASHRAHAAHPSELRERDGARLPPRVDPLRRERGRIGALHGLSMDRPAARTVSETASGRSARADARPRSVWGRYGLQQTRENRRRPSSETSSRSFRDSLRRQSTRQGETDGQRSRDEFASLTLSHQEQFPRPSRYRAALACGGGSWPLGRGAQKRNRRNKALANTLRGCSNTCPKGRTVWQDSRHNNRFPRGGRLRHGWR